MTPIIYIRGYAGTKDAVESAVDSPCYGANDGSTRVRLDGKERPALHLFESPLIRLMREYGFKVYMKGKRAEDDGWSRFQIEMKLLPLYSRRIFSDFEGDFLFRGIVKIGSRDPGDDGSREVEWSWKPLDPQATQKAVLKKPQGTHRIELPIQGSQLTAEQLQFEIEPW